MAPPVRYLTKFGLFGYKCPPSGCASGCVSLSGCVSGCVILWSDHWSLISSTHKMLCLANFCDTYSLALSPKLLNAAGHWENFPFGSLWAAVAVFMAWNYIIWCMCSWRRSRLHSVKVIEVNLILVAEYIVLWMSGGLLWHEECSFSFYHCLFLSSKTFPLHFRLISTQMSRTEFSLGLIPRGLGELARALLCGE